MNHRILAAALLAALAATSAHAAAPRDEAPQRTGMRLDVDGDGAIDRGEAARAPRLAQRFDRLDADRDGRLQAEELRHARKGRGPHGHRRMHGVDGLARLDADGDGRISRAELEAAQARREAGADERRSRAGDGARPLRPDLLARFDDIDGNRDGLLSRGELHAWFEAQRPRREAELRRRFEERFAAADLNGDGRLSRVEVEEKMPRLAGRFAWMDEDGDGFLGREELRPPSRR